LYCFEVTENVNPGFTVVRGRGSKPYVVTPEGAPPMRLSRVLMEAIQRTPEGASLRYGARHRDGLTAVPMEIRMRQGAIELGKALHGRCTRALVRVATMAGFGGRITLTSDTFDRVFSDRSLIAKKAYRPFPDVGIAPLCGQELLERMRQGVQSLEVLLLLERGAGFRIQRNGRLEGGAAQMFVRWDGQRLTLRAIHKPPRAHVGAVAFA